MALEQNLKSISHMVKAGKREITLVRSAVIRLTSLGRSLDPKDGAALGKLLRSIQRFSTALGTRLEALNMLTLWQVVMLVTCAEAYLQDLLASAASIDSDLMSKSQRNVPYVDVISAASLEELANELRVKWARDWLSDGGPIHWISRLEKMGARGYPKDLAARLELIWGIRHVVVHAAGVASAGFVRRHPGVAQLGDRVRVPLKTFEGFLDAVGTFLVATDQFFLARYPSLNVVSTKQPGAKVRKA